MAADPIANVVVGGCDAPHCPSEVTTDDGRVVFTSVESMVHRARHTGWYVADDHSILACPLHARRRHGRVIGYHFDKGRRDLGLAAFRADDL